MAQRDSEIPFEPPIYPSETSVASCTIKARSTPALKFSRDSTTRWETGEDSSTEDHDTRPAAYHRKGSKVLRCSMGNRPPPSTPPESSIKAQLSMPTLPVLSYISVPSLIEDFRLKRRVDPEEFDRKTQVIKQALTRAKIERGGSPFLLGDEYTVELASRLDAEMVERWIEDYREFRYEESENEDVPNEQQHINETYAPNSIRSQDDIQQVESVTSVGNGDIVIDEPTGNERPGNETVGSLPAHLESILPAASPRGEHQYSNPVTVRCQIVHDTDAEAGQQKITTRKTYIEIMECFQHQGDHIPIGTRERDENRLSQDKLCGVGHDTTIRSHGVKLKVQDDPQMVELARALAVRVRELSCEGS